MCWIMWSGDAATNEVVSAGKFLQENARKIEDGERDIYRSGREEGDQSLFELNRILKTFV